ncbi:MAG: caspase domain-containing protein, partial [bacterium]
PDVPFADRSTELFKKVARKRLGIPNDSNHMFVFTEGEATAGSLKGGLASLLSQLDSNDELYFYYAGHGVPNPNPNKSSAYILPQDAYKGYFQYPSFKLSTLYQKLANSKAKRVVAFVDACFSGQASKDRMVFEGVAPAGRMVGSADVSQSITGNMTVLTAGNNSQFSNSYNKRGHRLFSYYLMKGLLKGKQGEQLTEYVKSKVKQQSRRKGPAYEQTPQVYGRGNLGF